MKVFKDLVCFCKSTTIHGFQYVGEETLRLGARIAWLTLILISFTLAGFLIRLAFEDWGANPIITTIESTAFPVEEVLKYFEHY